MQINSKKIKKIILSNLPYAIFAYAGNKLAFAYRIAEGEGFQEKLPPFLYEIGTSFTKVFPSFNHVDLLAGISVAALMKMILYMKSKNKKKFRRGIRLCGMANGKGSYSRQTLESEKQDLRNGLYSVSKGLRKNYFIRDGSCCGVSQND